MQMTPPPSVIQKIMQLALPMVGTQFVIVGSGFLCMTMLSKLGHLVLAASALIFSVSLTLMVVSISLLFSLSILIGQAYGRQDDREVGSLWQQGWLLSFIISLPCLLIYWYIDSILIFFGQDPHAVAIVKVFFRASIWGIVPLLLGICNQQLCYGVHKQRLDMLANGIGVIVLLFFARTLIFGKLGMPPLGVAGFGYAQAIECLFYFLFTTACLYKLKYFKKFNLFQLRLSQTWDVLKNIIRIGWPISLQMNGEMLSFFISTVFVGWLGTVPLAAFQVMMQYEVLSVIPVFAISQACGVLISQAVGSRQFNDIKKLSHGSLYITVLLCGLIGMAFIVFPKTLISFYLDIHDPKNAKVLHLAILLFAIMALSQLLDGIRNVLLGSLRGLLDTRFAMLAGLLTIWLVSVPLGYLFAFPFKGGAVGAMLGWTVGMLISISIFVYRWRVVSRSYGAGQSTSISP
ncbi:MAG: efflux family protein [Gammaproteobacteria bacterium]|jgi:MATE family multidrug resistance protein|nr:efflux family protein [Gammaproteobacteria bacterium]